MVPEVSVSRADDERKWSAPGVAGAAAAGAAVAGAAGVAGAAVGAAAVIPTVIWAVGPYRLVSRALPIVGTVVAWYFLGPTTTLVAACLLMST